MLKCATPSTPAHSGGFLLLSTKTAGGHEMGQRSRSLTEIFGFGGWRVVEYGFEDPRSGKPVLQSSFRDRERMIEGS